MRYLVDTNLIIDHLRGDAKASSILQEIENGARQAAISVITEYEVLVGIGNSADEDKVNSLLKLIPAINVTSPIIRSAAYFHRIYKTDVVDAIIAATAHNTKATLLTRNTKHFNNIKEIQIIAP